MTVASLVKFSLPRLNERVISGDIIVGLAVSREAGAMFTAISKSVRAHIS